MKPAHFFHLRLAFSIPAITFLASNFFPMSLPAEEPVSPQVVSRRDQVIAHIRQGEFTEADIQIELIRNGDSSITVKAGDLYEIAKEWKYNRRPDRAVALHRYNSETFPMTLKGMWSQVEIIKDAFVKGDFTSVQSHYDLLLRRFADQATLPKEICLIGRAYAKAGKVDRALELHRYNVLHYPTHPYGALSRSEITCDLIRKKEFASAQAQYLELRQYTGDPTTLPESFYTIGIAYMKSGDPDKAFEIHQHNAALFGDTDHGRWSCVEVAFYYIDQEDYSNAAAACLNFINRYVEHPSLSGEIRNMLNRYAAKGELAQARTLCETVLQACPNSEKMIWMQNGLIQIYLDQAAQTEAEEVFEKLLADYAQNPELADAVKALGGYCCRKSNDFSMALQFYGRFLSVYSSHPRAIEVEAECASVCLSMGAFTQADAALQGILEKYPNHPGLAQIINGFANRYRQRNMHARAMALYQTALAKARDNKDEQLSAIAGMTKAQIRLGSPMPDSNDIGGLPAGDPDGLAMVEMLMADYPEVKELAFHVFQIGEEYFIRAEESLRVGNPITARADFLTAIAIWEKNRTQLVDPEHRTYATYYTAEAFQRIEEYEKAVTCFQEVVDRWPDYEKAWYAQYQIAKTVEQLARQEKATTEEVRGAYQILLEKYPDCSAAQTANKKLSTL